MNSEMIEHSPKDRPVETIDWERSVADSTDRQFHIIESEAERL